MNPPPLTLRTAGPDQTRAAGAATARVLRPGDVVALTGELGAGKTCFVQGAAGALGVAERITSPTFMLLRCYRGDVEVAHLDVYRLDRLQEVLDLGEEVMGEDQVTFVEWGDAVTPLLPSEYLEIELLLDDDADERVLRLRGTGGWHDRLTELEAQLRTWIDPTVGV